MKNEQLMIYILIAILYGAVGFLFYKKYQSKEKYDVCDDTYDTCLSNCTGSSGNQPSTCINNCKNNYRICQMLY